MSNPAGVESLSGKDWHVVGFSDRFVCRVDATNVAGGFAMTSRLSSTLGRTATTCLLLLLTVGRPFSTTSTAAPEVRPPPVLFDVEGRVGPFRHGTLVTKELNVAMPVDEDILTHPGVDLVAPCGAGVYALADGWVEDLIDSADDRDFRALGFMVMVRHLIPIRGKPTYTLYLHLQEAPSVRKGAAVKGSGPLYGTRLGSVGKTGVATKCHVHFEIRHFASRYLADPQWRRKGNIYGKGNQNGARVFTDNWEDPALFLGQDWADFFDHLISPDGSRYVSLTKLDKRRWTTAAETRLVDLVTRREVPIPFVAVPARVRQRWVGEDWGWHQDGYFRWSTGGRFIAFTRCSGDEDKPICLPVVVDATTRRPPEFVAVDVALSRPLRPRIRPVGFVGGRLLLTTLPDLYAYELVSKHAVVLERGVWSAALSGDRRTVAYARVDGDMASVWVSDADGANKRRLAVFAGTTQVDVIGWLPGDQAVVFRNDNAANKPEAWAVKPDGSRPEKIGW